MRALLAAAILAPSCNPNPAGYLDGIVTGVAGCAILLALALRRWRG